MQLRTLYFDQDAAVYDLLIATERGEHYDQVDELGLSERIELAPEADRARLRSLRRLTHRHPFQWVPIDAADGRAA